jgi:hypothetical protein
MYPESISTLETTCKDEIKEEKETKNASRFFDFVY